MEIAEIVVHERTNDQGYDLEEWNRLRPLITQLYEQKRRTRKEIVEFLGERLNFHVNEAMLQYRLCRWNLRKNQTKRATENIVRQPSRPNIDSHKELILKYISSYVDQSFKNKDWAAETISTDMTDDYLNWAYDNPHPLFNVFGCLQRANMCFSLEQPDWGRKLLHEGIKELETCLHFVALCNEQPYQVVQVILALFITLSRQPTEVRESFLKHCHDLTKYYNSPHHQLLVEAMKMEQEHHEPESQIDAFAKALIVFVDKTRDHLEQNAFAYSLCNHLNQALGITESQAGESQAEAWKDPAELQSRDPEYFNSNNNIKQTIVLAVELHGYQELLQLRKALECQVNSASTGRSHEMILEHLRKLEKLIHRIACRDFWKADDQIGFMEHWRFMTDGEAGSTNLNHLFDMLYALRAFAKWGKQVEAQFIKARLGEAFRIPSKPEAATVESLP